MSRGLREETFCRREGMRTNESVERATSSRKLWGRGIWNWFDQILNRTKSISTSSRKLWGPGIWKQFDQTFHGTSSLPCLWYWYSQSNDSFLKLNNSHVFHLMLEYLENVKYQQTTWSGDPDTLLPFLKSKMQIVSGHSYNFTRSRACAS